MENAIEKIKRKDGSITSIYHDDCFADSPRDWDGNIGTMVCSHSGYILGDVQLKSDVSFLDHINSEFNVVEPDGYWLEKKEEKIIKQWINDNLICLPLYLYDHGGITMSTGSFNDPWDSGRVGIIYVTKEKLKKEMRWYHLTRRRIRKAVSYLEGEVKDYDDYLTGNVYGFVTEMPIKCECCGKTEMEHIDSCWGFYGYDFEESGLYAHAGITKEELEMT